MITPEMLKAAMDEANPHNFEELDLPAMADHLNRSAWRDVATDPPLSDEVVLFCWDGGPFVVGVERGGRIFAEGHAYPFASGPRHWQPLPPAAGG